MNSDYLYHDMNDEKRMVEFVDLMIKLLDVEFEQDALGWNKPMELRIGN